MNINEIDKFRNDFFDKVIKAEQEKEKAKQLVQKRCFHTYNQITAIHTNGYQERTCSKCGHSAIKNVRVWEGTKDCIIS